MKTQPGAGDVDAFLESVPDERRRAEGRELLALMRERTGEQPVMWGPSMVGFGSRHYAYESGREGDWFVVGFSPRKAALTLYGLQSAYRPEETEELLDRLGPHKLGKSCIYVSRLDKVDKAVLGELVDRAVAAAKSAG